MNFLKRDLAIVVDSVEGIRYEEYIYTLGDTMNNPNLIIAASRISNQRICMYLDSKQSIDKVLNTIKSITVKGHTLQIRPLVNQNKRIIISNVHPSIPHDVIIAELTKLGITIKSGISCLRAGLSRPEYAHIISFRRQVYIKAEDAEKIPSSIQITYEEGSHWIFLSGDTVSCFLCKEQGHLARDCPKQTKDTPDNQAFEELSKINSHKPTDLPSRAADNIHRPTETNNEMLAPPMHPTAKRTRSSSTPSEPRKHSKPHVDTESTTETTETLNEVDMETDDEDNYASQSDDSTTTNLNDSLQPFKSVIEKSPEKHPLSYLQLKALLENATGNKNVIELALKSNPNLNAINTMLEEARSVITNRSTKSKCTRLQNKIKKHLNIETAKENKRTTRHSEKKQSTTQHQFE